MTYELIITEKPNAAKMIAQALADGKPIKEAHQGVPYYKVTHGNKDIVVGCAVGHLYTVAEKEKSFKYPSFELEWKATSELDDKSFTKKYVATLKKLAKDAKEFTVATDYDIEGEVIGLNCVKYICKQKDAARMKFSTLTKPDVIDSYKHKSKSLDWGQAHAGETRHFLDWMYGINLSRALTLAVRTTGMFKIMSAGRVQGPALKLIVDKEKEINAFKPTPYWEIQINGHFEKSAELIECWHEKGTFDHEKDALHIVQKIKGKHGAVKKIDTSQFIQKPPTPFDLTTLQTDAYRHFGITPKHTLEIAQELYTAGYISYPRTSSQQLPKEIGYKKIFDALAKDEHYKPLVKSLSEPHTPTQGKKTDPAHPAIYPTGVLPKTRGDRQHKIYDLIVKRFLACFGKDATRETITITIDVAGEPFITKGTRTTVPGWHVLYAPYVKLDEQEMPRVKEKDHFDIKDVIKHDKQTQPPKRYTPASIIRELEKEDLGTKATRAAILESLYDRNYIKNESIEATDLGIQTVEILEKYCPEILDTQLTRHFEKEMEQIREHKLKSETVLGEAKIVLTKLLEKFKKQEKAIGKELQVSQKQSLEKESYIGPCPVCKKGTLRITYSKKSKKKFIACDAYPDCKTIFNLPSFGKVQNTEKTCAQCHYPVIRVLAGRRTRETCINAACPSKQTQDKELLKEIHAMESGKLKKKCPKCGKELVVRTSIYGQFLGCSSYPKCRHIERIPKSGDAVKTPAVPAHSTDAQNATKTSATPAATKTVKKTIQKKPRTSKKTQSLPSSKSKS